MLLVLEMFRITGHPFQNRPTQTTRVSMTSLAVVADAYMVESSSSSSSYMDTHAMFKASGRSLVKILEGLELPCGNRALV
jgi:hypothetical protein